MSSRFVGFVASGLIMAGMAIVTPDSTGIGQSRLQNVEHVQEARARDPEALAPHLVLQHRLPDAIVCEEQDTARGSAAGRLTLESGQRHVVSEQLQTVNQVVDGSGVKRGCSGGLCRPFHGKPLFREETAEQGHRLKKAAPLGDSAQEQRVTPPADLEQQLDPVDANRPQTGIAGKPIRKALLPRLASLRALHRVRQGKTP